MCIAFPGHLLSEECIAIDPKKVEKISNISTPKDKGGIRSVLRFGTYYKYFIKSYCVITSPPQELLKKSIHFKLGDEQQDAFNNLKEALCIAPPLEYVDPNKPYIVDTDAINLTIGTVLSQVQDDEEKVIMYGSKAISGSQR